MTPKQKAELALSQKRQRLGEIAKLEGDALTDEIRAERDGILGAMPDLEAQYQAATLADPERNVTVTDTPDAETAARLELRAKVNVSDYFRAATGRRFDGAARELAQECGIADDGSAVPLELWERRAAPDGDEHRALTGAPSTVGVNMDAITPAIFAPSVAPLLGVDMPMVESGTYATARISTSATAAAKAASGGVPETAATITPQTTTAHRVGGSIGTTLEAIATSGAANFEAALRENIAMVVSDELNRLLINGDTDTDTAEPNGFLDLLTDPTAPVAGVETFMRLAQIQAGGVDGLWAGSLADVGILCGVDTYTVAASKFQGASNAPVEDSAAAYLERVGRFFTANARMPAKASHVQAGIMYKAGRPETRTALVPHWGYVAIDDPYSGRLKGERFFTVSVLVGDLILVQPSAYAQVAFRVST
ncbi:MAG: hypothetical protein F4Y04_05305 [Chloroflexi bacterium]|nr:hypothetical protein [Chloroflexota bacterium]